MGAPVDFTQVYYHVSVIFAICNSCLNPIIYSLKNKPYRVGLKEALRCGPLSAITKTASRLAGLSKTDDSSQVAPVHNIEGGTTNSPMSSMILRTPKHSPRNSPNPSPKIAHKLSHKPSPKLSNGYDVSNNI